jgi:nucleotide-binding universal stress UspA family protein
MAKQPSGPVIVGVDGSAAGMAAVDLAAEEALARVAPLVVVHAPGGRTGSPMPGGLEGARRAVAVAVGRARAEHPGLAVTGELVPGDPAAVLVARSHGTSLVVVGHRRRREFGERPVGSVATAVVARAEAPVIVHRPVEPEVTTQPWPLPVLVGVGGDVATDPVVAFAFEEAALRGTSLLAVHVWSNPADACAAGLDACGYSAARARADAEWTLTAALERWAEKYPEVRVRLAVRHAPDVPVALTAATRSAQLAVVGARRHPGAVRASVGAVSQVLLHRAGCPVAVVPA